MKAFDKQAWAAAYNSEFVGFQQWKVLVFKVVRPEPGVKIHDTLTSSRLEYKEDNSDFLKNKVFLCARGDQQIPGVSFKFQGSDGRTSIPPTQEHLRNATSCSQMAYAHFNMDGAEWIFYIKQREDYLQEAQW